VTLVVDSFEGEGIDLEAALQEADASLQEEKANKK
jgi:hypothetical protein